MSAFYLSQLLAAIAFLLGIFCFQLSNRSTVLRVLAVSTLCNALHFFVLGRPGPAVLEGIACVRQFLASWWPLKRIALFFISLAIVCFFFQYKHPVSLLGLVGASFGTIASFTADVQKMRIIFLLASAIWALHNALIASPVAMGMEVFFALSSAVSWVRYKK